MARWEYTLKLKDLWAEATDDDDEQAVGVAPKAAERLRAFAKQIEARKPHLAIEIEDVADEFEDVLDTGSPKRAFNHTLDGLYDLADAHSIWIA